MMKRINKRIGKFVTLLSVCCLLLTSINSGTVAYADASNDESLDLLGDDVEEVAYQLPSGARYSEDEVIVMLKNTSNNDELELYSVYSDDISLEQTELCLANCEDLSVDVASVELLNEQLGLNISFSEARLLNPSKKDNNINSDVGLVNATQNSGTTYTIDESNNNIFSIKLEDIDVSEALEILNDNPNVAIAEPNYLYKCDVVPNDTLIGELYALEKINAYEAWDVTTGDENVVVGIIDTGIDGTHPDLVDNIWDNPHYAPGVGCMACSLMYDFHGYNFTGYGSEDGNPCGGEVPTDRSGHGTHVAGIIGAEGKNGEGVAGVNWNVSLAWLGTDEGDGAISISAAIEALNYANNHDIMIVNNSYSGYVYSAIFEQAIKNYDGLFIASAGNEGNNNDILPVYPASYDCPNIISVAACDKFGDPTGFTNYGDESVDVVAPGDAIKSTLPGNNYDYASGTSMSAPYVTGIAALIKAENPDFNAMQIKAAICGTVQQSGCTYEVKYDGGVVDAFEAVSLTSASLRGITYNLNYADAPSPFTEYVVYGGVVSEPNYPPVRSGYVFKGWYTSPNGGTLFDFNAGITSSITVYAQWNDPVTGSYGVCFPDYNFRKEVLRLLNDIDGGCRTHETLISEVDIFLMSSIDSLDISRMYIRDLTGIEFFSGMISLDFSTNAVENVCLTYCENLEVLNCTSNRLGALNVCSLTELRQLYCKFNFLKVLDVSALHELTQLNITFNEISTIDVSMLEQLQYLTCGANKLSCLNVSMLTDLVYLDCSGNQLETLTVESLNKLEYLYCGNNKLTQLVTGKSVKQLNCSDNYLYVLDVKRSTELSKLNCSNNELTIIDVRGLARLFNFDITYNDMCASSDFIGYNNWEYIGTTEFVSGAFSPQNTWTDNPFTDVSESDYFYKAVEYVAENGFMGGTSATTFSPTNTITRAQLVTVLYRMAGEPDVSSLSIPFTDVSSSASYYNAVKWAYNNGSSIIMGGTSATKFSPNSTVTREMAAVVIDRYATRIGYTMEAIRDYEAFTDADDISNWAVSSIEKLYAAGVINGTLGYYYPTDTIERGDLAVIIRKFEVIRLYL